MYALVSVSWESIRRRRGNAPQMRHRRPCGSAMPTLRTELWSPAVGGNPSRQASCYAKFGLVVDSDHIMGSVRSRSGAAPAMMLTTDQA
jgi:hypothetical protein